MSDSTLKIGMIGLDTSHVTAFTEMLHNIDHPYHVPGGRIVTAFPGGSPDFELSRSRVQGFTEDLSGTYGVEMKDTIEEVAAVSDAILLESVDGRVHREQFMKVAPYGKPVFIDKPFAISLADAETIAAAAKQYQVPLMSCSALRYAEGLTADLENSGKESIM
ncbi:Gfo/Idh/MocA family oxidoreductase, partial [Paenibacillus sepulcri]|nr:Gfo/Idh/MocA family oxidoreductase [Paenibacillus sepulcri]